MADVQLEKGYVQLSNRLMEAMIGAGFSVVQWQIVLTLARLTYGWRRRSVSLSTTDLATYAGFAPRATMKPRAGGRFRAELQDLIQQGVVVVVDGGRGARQLTLCLQKDFEAWGRFSVNEQRLTSVWFDRPADNDRTADHALRERKSENAATKTAAHAAYAAATAAAESASDAHDDVAQIEANYVAQTEATSLVEGGPDQGHDRGPNPGQLDQNNVARSLGHYVARSLGHVDARKSFNDETYDSRKDMRDSSSVVSTDHIGGAGIARDARKPTPDSVARFLQTRATANRNDWRAELAQLATDFGQPAVDRACHDALLVTQPVSSIRVFRRFVETAARDAENEPTSSTAHLAAAAPTTPAAHVETLEEIRERYDVARAEVGKAWVLEPGHAAPFAEMVEGAKQRLGLAGSSVLGSTFGQAVAEAEALRLASIAAGFPDFETWAHSQTHTTS